MRTVHSHHANRTHRVISHHDGQPANQHSHARRAFDFDFDALQLGARKTGFCRNAITPSGFRTKLLWVSIVASTLAIMMHASTTLHDFAFGNDALLWYNPTPTDEALQINQNIIKGINWMRSIIGQTGKRFYHSLLRLIDRHMKTISLGHTV